MLAVTAYCFITTSRQTDRSSSLRCMTTSCQIISLLEVTVYRFIATSNNRQHLKAASAYRFTERNN